MLHELCDNRLSRLARQAVRAVSEAAEGKVLAEGLLERGFGFVDNFLGEPLASYVRDELLDMEVLHARPLTDSMRREARLAPTASHTSACPGGERTPRPPHHLAHGHWQTKGLLERGELAGGKTGGNTRYTMEAVRGDVVCWVTGSEEGCHNIGLLRELKDQVVFAVKVRPHPGAAGPRAALGRTSWKEHVAAMTRTHAVAERACSCNVTHACSPYKLGQWRAALVASAGGEQALMVTAGGAAGKGPRAGGGGGPAREAHVHVLPRVRRAESMPSPHPPPAR
jgi:hypothetical protein